MKKGLLFVCLLMSSFCFAFAPFTVRNIDIRGNNRLSRATILTYVPLSLGERISKEKTALALRSLYASGLFENVEIARQDDTLIILVHERPVIGSIAVHGNSLIPKDKIQEVMKEVGLVRGQIFDRAVLDHMKKSLQSSYLEQGRYSAAVVVHVVSQDHNRVAIHIDIDEGKATVVKEIKIIGNDTYSSYRLTQNFELTTTKLWSFITGGDKYSKEKLHHDVDVLQQFYADRGFLEFKVNSHHAALNKDKSGVYIVIHITEGPRYRFVGYELLGNLLGSQEALNRALDLEPGTVYSQKAIRKAQRKIGQYFGRQGFVYTRVQILPEIDERNHTVKIKFHVLPGNRYYVRQIHFAGNNKTADNVLRREVHQLEAAPINTVSLDHSLRNLRVLGYLKDVNMKMEPAPETNDQLDLLFHVTELASSSAMVSGGYGTNGVGLVLGASLNQQNFLGTGNTVGVNFQRDQYKRSYRFDYENPYYTINGVRRGFHFYSSRTSPSRINLEDYRFDNYGGNVDYRIPLSDYSGFDFSLGYERIKVDIGDAPSTQVLNFVNSNGRQFRYGTLSVGWDYNSYDQAPFTTAGFKQAVNAIVAFPAGGPKLEYFKLNYMAHYFHPITKTVILSLAGNMGYGSNYGVTVGGLPFFQNYIAGGFDTVRGYDQGSLGPKSSKGAPLGGNALVSGSAGLIFPNPISENLRTSVFLDAGNVYNTRLDNINIGAFRYSTGLSAVWQVPMIGVVRFAVAKALKTTTGDRPRVFDFSIGGSF